VPPTAVRRSAATPTSSAPRRSSNRRLPLSCYGFSTLLWWRLAGVYKSIAAWEVLYGVKMVKHYSRYVNI
jgi:hypothetical protein